MERIELTPWFYYDVCDNGKRIIHIPSPELKKVQRLILRKYFKPYCRMKSAKECAAVHCGKKRLMKLDIKDFFNSICEEQIREVVRRCINSSPESVRLITLPTASPYPTSGEWNKDAGSREASDVKQIISICTINGKLPTGAPTSPYIANLILKDFDLKIYECCKKFGVTYSRYMDDLFFSTDREQYFLSLVELEVLKQFKELGFEVNVEKIKYISGNKQQKVLGLGVNNDRPVLTKEDKRKYRSYFYNIIAPVQFNKQKQFKEKEKEVFGHLAYIKSVDEEFYIRMIKYIFNLINRLNIGQKLCLKKLIKIC